MLVGAALGATFGFLFAPKSGKNFRKDLKKKKDTNDLLQSIKEYLIASGKDVADEFNELKNDPKIKKELEKIQKSFDKETQKIKKSIQSKATQIKKEAKKKAVKTTKKVKSAVKKTTAKAKKEVKKKVAKTPKKAVKK